jgi:hypothetical protein
MVRQKLYLSHCWTTGTYLRYFMNTTCTDLTSGSKGTTGAPPKHNLIVHSLSFAPRFQFRQRPTTRHHTPCASILCTSARSTPMLSHY